MMRAAMGVVLASMAVWRGVRVSAAVGRAAKGYFFRMSWARGRSPRRAAWWRKVIAVARCEGRLVGLDVEVVDEGIVMSVVVS